MEIIQTYTTSAGKVRLGHSYERFGVYLKDDIKELLDRIDTEEVVISSVPNAHGGKLLLMKSPDELEPVWEAVCNLTEKKGDCHA